jgi:hypothetical protein
MSEKWLTPNTQLLVGTAPRVDIALINARRIKKGGASVASLNKSVIGTQVCKISNRFFFILSQVVQLNIVSRRVLWAVI